MTLRREVAWALRLLVAAGLAVDAGIHAALAPSQPPNGTINQVDLFYLEAAVASVTVLLVLTYRSRATYGVALLVALSALGTVVLYRYVDIGPLGPLPDMYAPFWYASKLATAIAEAITVIAALIGISAHPRVGSNPPAPRTSTRV